MIIQVAKDFSPYLGGRYIKDGFGSAEEFFNRFLEIYRAFKVINKEYKITFDFFDVCGIPSSWYDELEKRLESVGLRLIKDKNNKYIRHISKIKTKNLF